MPNFNSDFVLFEAENIESSELEVIYDFGS